ncbi:uncharacterized protein [Rutidosis leptorrhynchoides]|uniref:uncharacterized protein isoform X2 n=1 Tax=Rutidosis leptorrhynchoides TaxID=125765 RepID=UPI003A99C6D7
MAALSSKMNVLKSVCFTLRRRTMSITTSDKGKMNIDCAKISTSVANLQGKGIIWDGANKDKQRIAAAIDDDSKIPVRLGGGYKLPIEEASSMPLSRVEEGKQPPSSSIDHSTNHCPSPLQLNTAVATETTETEEDYALEYTLDSAPRFLSQKSMWDPQILKVSYNDMYKTLSHEQQRLWLKAHFVLRRRCCADLFEERRFVESDEDEKHMREREKREREKRKMMLRDVVHPPPPILPSPEKSQMASYIDDEDQSDSEVEIIEFDIVCSDGIMIDGGIFEMESRMIQAYYYIGLTSIEVESNSEIIKKVEFFCKERVQICDHYRHDQLLRRHKLNEFNSIFYQLHRADALDLIIAAFDLNIISLMELMMEEVAHLISKMTTDEVYNIFSVNLKHYNPKKFQWMKEFLEGYECF